MVKQTALLSLLPQHVVMFLIAMIYYLLMPGMFLIPSGLTYLALSFLLRTLIPKMHRKGIRLTRQKRYQEAIPCFQASFRFFSKHALLDRFRFITLLSSSRISYTEMALLNEAFCLTQIEKKDEAIARYEEVLKRFPGSQMAATALNMLKL